MTIFSKSRTIAIPVAFSISMFLFSCGGGSAETPPAPAPVEADFMEVQAKNTHIEKKYPGAIEGSVNVDIKAQVSGYLDQIYVKEGDYVKKGQSLFRIKGDVYNQQVNNAQASYEAALAAEKNARIEVNKIRPLVEAKVYSELQLETAEANLASAAAMVSQAKASLGSSQVNAAFTLIKAPVSGYIGRIPNRIGNLVSVAQEDPLTTLSDIDQVFVYFSLSEADFISFVKDRQSDIGMNTVELVMADGTLYDKPGKIEIASGNVDRTTGSIALKAVFPNPGKVLRSGGSGRIVLKKALTEVLTVPMAAVKDIQDRFFVFALSDSNTVAMKAIEIVGKSHQDYILKSGLKAGEKIALNRIDMLNDGMPVVPTTKK